MQSLMKTSAFLMMCLQVANAHDHEDDHDHDHATHVYYDWYAHNAMPTARSDMTATTVGEGIYVLGGCASNQLYNYGDDYYYCGNFDGVTDVASLYLPESKAWRVLPAMPRKRYRHAAAAVNTDIYVFGGTDDSDNIVYQVDKFDTVTETWSTLSQTMTNAYRDLSAFVYNNEIYAVGGYNASYNTMSAVQKFDISTGTWSQVASLGTSRGDCGTAVIGNSVYVVGGFSETNWCAPLKSVEKIDLTDMSVTSTGIDLVIGRGDKAVIALNGRVHVMGGETKDSSCSTEPLRDVEIFESETSMWKYAGEIPYSLNRFRIAVASYESSIFLFGGQGSVVGTLNQNGSYYPVSDTVLEYFEDMHTEVEDHSHDEHDDNHALATASLVFGILGLIMGIVAIVLYCGSSRGDSEDGSSGARCVPSMTKQSEVTMVPLKNEAKGHTV